MSNLYVVDNNVLVFLQWGDPHFQFGPIYTWLDQMAQDGRVLVPEVVMDEFKNKERKPWFEARPYFRFPFDDHQDQCLSALVNQLPDFVDPTKTKEDGDQPLVAAAMALNQKQTGSFCSGPAIIVSHEQRRKESFPFLKVPDACDHYKIHCVDFFEMLRIEGVLTI